MAGRSMNCDVRVGSHLRPLALFLFKYALEITKVLELALLTEYRALRQGARGFRRKRLV
jgi:hypothetical protein